jgi:hypothetical protein
LLTLTAKKIFFKPGLLVFINDLSRCASSHNNHPRMGLFVNNEPVREVRKDMGILQGRLPAAKTANRPP